MPNLEVGDLIAHKRDTADVYLIVDEYTHEHDFVTVPKKFVKLMRLSDGDIYTYSKQTIEELSIKIA